MSRTWCFRHRLLPYPDLHRQETPGPPPSASNLAANQPLSVPQNNFLRFHPPTIRPSNSKCRKYPFICTEGTWMPSSPGLTSFQLSTNKPVLIQSFRPATYSYAPAVWHGRLHIFSRPLESPYTPPTSPFNEVIYYHSSTRTGWLYENQAADRPFPVLVWTWKLAIAPALDAHRALEFWKTKIYSYNFRKNSSAIEEKREKMHFCSLKILKDHKLASAKQNF